MTKSRKVGIAFALLLTFALVFANIIPFTTLGNANVAHAATVQSRDEWSNSYSGTYYNNLNESLTGTAFRSELANLITTTHTHQTSYDELKTVFKTTDADPDNPGNVIWFYTGNSVPYTGAMDSGNYPTNREHVWPKMGGSAFPEKSQAGSDAHHLRPLNTGLNNTRSNYQFGEVTQSTGSRVMQSGSYSSYGTSDPDTWCYLSGGLFYPAKGYRGATARILFYVQTRWGDVSNLSFVLGNGSTKTMGHIDTLLKWHIEEPPTDEEIRRNEAVFGVQGNRNPFIDHPEYAEMIYCHDGKNYNNSLQNVVAQYGSYLDNSNSPTPPALTGLTLSQTSLNLTEGQVSQQITVTATPSTASNAVTWSTSNSSVATVNNGVVTAVGAGTATITATSTVNTNIKATLSVTVSAKKIEVQAISISPSSLTLTQGDTGQLTVTASPSGASNSVTWSTSNSSVATVVNGVVTAVGVGTATITATSAENTSVKSSMTITVVSGKVELQSLSILPVSLTLKPGETGNLIVGASPSGASNSVTWSSSDISVATVTQGGVVTAVSAGVATITATSTENPNITATMLVTVVSDALRVESLSISPTDITLYLGREEIALMYVTASPAGASNAVTWSSSDESVAVIFNASSEVGYLAAVGEGTAIITATSVDNPSVSVSITITVVREPSSPEAIAEFNKCMDEYNSATTLEERYNALKKAMQAFNNLSLGDREQSSDYYRTLKTAVVEYNNDATRENDKFESAVLFVSQVSAASFSIAFLVLLVAITKVLIVC